MQGEKWKMENGKLDWRDAGLGVRKHPGHSVQGFPDSIGSRV